MLDYPLANGRRDLGGADRRDFWNRQRRDYRHPQFASPATPAGKGIPLEGQNPADVITLLENFWEASFTGDPSVIA